jgi:hypothetical protein
MQTNEQWLNDYEENDVALKSSAKGGGGGFEPIPVGTYIARCVSVIDLGYQESEYLGVPKIQEKVYIGFEVPEVRVKWTKDDVEHEGAGLIGSIYTNSIYEKANLGGHLISWRGRPFTDEEKEAFDLFTVLDVPCMLSVIHKPSKDGSRVYANISAIMGLPKGTTAPKRETPLMGYSPNDDERSDVTGVPEWLQKIMGEKVDPTPEPEPQPDPGDFDDDIPF